MPRLRDRLYQEFFMGSRLPQYRVLLESALTGGFRICTISDFWKATACGNHAPEGKWLVLRHDIDSDLATAKLMWEIERELQVRSTYFFRLSTLDVKFLRDIHDRGSEVGYHYEELATLAKHYGWSRPEDVARGIPGARAAFLTNLQRLRRQTAIPIRVAAAHGDFVNRRVGIPNTVILEDAGLRRESEIELEAYDEACMRFVEGRHADDDYPRLWKPSAPLQSTGVQRLYVLVHPRQWRSRFWCNAALDSKRIYEGMKLGALSWLRSQRQGNVISG